MEIVIIVAIAVAAIAWFIWNDHKRQESGSHPLDGATKTPEPWPFPTSRPPEGDAKPAAEPMPVMPTLTAVLDVNKDGRVDIKDAVAAKDIVVAKTKKAAKKTQVKAAEVVKKTKAKAQAAVKKTKAKKSK
jgi:hypothetical protein